MQKPTDMKRMALPTSESVTFPPSLHMRLGHGLTSMSKFKHVSCRDVGIDNEDITHCLRPSLSESDLSRLFEPSNVQNRMDIVHQTIETNCKHQEMDSVEMIDVQLHACNFIEDQT
jgi:hypothetical protein